MRTPLVCLLALALLAGPTVGPAAGTGGSAPLADAGLDQHVGPGATVYLDGTDSLDPDGRIVRYRWTVVGPHGDVPVARPGAGRTAFVTSDPGRYVVVLRVTDDDGATATDRLYVTAGDTGGDVRPGELAVAVFGPGTVAPGEPASYTADANGSALKRIRWRIDGRVVAAHDVSGERATDTLTRRFQSPGGHAVNATVVAGDGRRASARRAVVVENATAAAAGGNAVPNGAPNVTGPRTVTGDDLTATYRLVDPNAPTFHWKLDGRRVGSGTSVTLPLAPGPHDLHAVRESDYRHLTFPDGGVGVVADPGPTLDAAISGGDALAVNATARDPGADLASLTVSVDGDRVASAPAGERVRTLRLTRDVAPGPHDVVVRAADERGQVAAKRSSVDVDVALPPDAWRCSARPTSAWSARLSVCFPV
ncbi:MAG: PKD domain-containing protein [Halarchaeum sp.]